MPVRAALYQAGPAWAALDCSRHSSPISRQHQRTPISQSSRPRLLDIVAAVTTAISFYIPHRRSSFDCFYYHLHKLRQHSPTTARTREIACCLWLAPCL